MTHKRMVGMVGALGLIVLLGAHTTATSASTPSRVATTTKASVGGPSMLDAVAFRTAQRGWVGGAHTILTTSDGGRSWTQQYAGTETIRRLSFVSDTTGWALGVNTLLRTTNSGQTWAPVGEPPQSLQQIDVLSPTLGWGVAGANSVQPLTLYRTGDGGRSWQRQGAPFAASSVCFADAGRGWLTNAYTGASSRAAVAATTNGGATWTATAPLPSSIGAGGFATQTLACTPSSSSVWDLVNYGGYAGGEGYALYHSADGVHWRAVVANMAASSTGAAAGPGTAPGDLAMVSPMAAFLSGTCGACGGDGTTTVGGTTDGGQTWHNYLVPGLSAGQTALSFPTLQDGWLVAQQITSLTPFQQRSVVLSSTNGGQTWQQRYPTSGPTISGVRVTFTLSLYGTVPPNEEFGLQGPLSSSGQGGEIPFCRTIAANVGPDHPVCRGAGTVYRRTVVVSRGSVVRFAYERYIVPAPNRLLTDTFYHSSKRAYRDTTIDAYYRFAR